MSGYNIDNNVKVRIYPAPPFHQALNRIGKSDVFHIANLRSLRPFIDRTTSESLKH